MTSQGRRIAGCHLLLRGNRWMPISVNKALGAKDRCSPGGAVISWTKFRGIPLSVCFCTIAETRKFSF
jgi:hypothetical protein